MNDKATHPTEGWAIQKNKRGVKHVTGLKPYGWGPRWLKCDKGLEIKIDDLFATKEAAESALVRYLDAELPKARKRAKTIEDTLFLLTGECR